MVTQEIEIGRSKRGQRVYAFDDIAIVPVTAEHARIARAAYRDYGRGSGHGAKLNFGDCFSYALAAETEKALLYVGDDFARTDLDSALDGDAGA